VFTLFFYYYFFSFLSFFSFFFFNHTPTTVFYPLSLHDALPICIASIINASNRSRRRRILSVASGNSVRSSSTAFAKATMPGRFRSEEHTSELQSRSDLVCRLLLEKKKKKK